ncbi:hypothetical protein [Pararobbsia alpina]|uniref:hypothetical protein n=1 Tax=Pararobbsia alpina TaxID=621374 RepID=UPI0015818200|nr:hypothetical protein [Pararobbsia alpina]
MFFLLDTNLFRLACKSSNGAFIIQLNSELGRYPYLKNDDITAFKMTPFGLLEYLGIVPPKAPIISIPSSVASSKSGTVIAGHVIKEAKKFYVARPELSVEHLSKKCEERKYVDPAAIDLFDICVEHPLRSESVERTIINALAFDYLYKYVFSENLLRNVLPFLFASFFLDDAQSSSVSKFRLSKRLWDKGKAFRKNAPDEQAGISFEELDKAMQIKNQQDYLDGDIVHFVAYGMSHEGQQCRVVAFTCDDNATVANRVIVHRNIGELIYAACEPDMKQRFEQVVSRQAGYVVTCDSTGRFTAISDLAH